MRIATTILSLVLMVVVSAKSCSVYVGGSALEQEGTAGGGALGLVMALPFLVAGASPCPSLSVARGLPRLRPLGDRGRYDHSSTDLTI